MVYVWKAIPFVALFFQLSPYSLCPPSDTFIAPRPLIFLCRPLIFLCRPLIFICRPLIFFINYHPLIFLSTVALCMPPVFCCPLIISSTATRNQPSVFASYFIKCRHSLFNCHQFFNCRPLIFFQFLPLLCPGSAPARPGRGPRQRALPALPAGGPGARRKESII